MVRQPKFINYFSYGMGDFLGAGAFALTSAWLLFFLTTFCGLSAVEASSIFAIARVVDAVMAPTMGYITDNFHKTKLGKRFGRRHFFILISIPLMVVYTLIWISGFSYWYYLTTYILFEIVYSMILIPYDTLAAEMSNNYQTRSKFTGARMFIAQASAVFAAYIPGRLIHALGQNDPMSFLYSGIIFTVIIMACLVLIYKFTWERPYDEIPKVEKKEERNFWQNVYKIYWDLFSTLRVKTFRHHLGMYLGGYISQDIFNAVFTYFVVFALLQSSVLASNLLTVMYLFQIAGVGIALWITLKMNPAPAYRAAISFFILGITGFIILHYSGASNSIMLIYTMIGICGLGRGGLNYIPWNNYTFIPDVDEALTGQRREGVFAGVMSLIRKASQALAVFLVGIALQESGFVSGKANQPHAAITAIVSILLFGTLAFLIWGLFVSFKYKLTKENHVVLLDEINRLKNGGSKIDATPEARKVFEELTGWKYEETWGDNTVGYENLIKYKENHIPGYAESHLKAK